MVYSYYAEPLRLSSIFHMALLSLTLMRWRDALADRSRAPSRDLWCAAAERRPPSLELSPAPRRGSDEALFFMFPWRLRCSSFLVMTCFHVRDYNILPKKELHKILQAPTFEGFLLPFLMGVSSNAGKSTAIGQRMSLMGPSHPLGSVIKVVCKDAQGFL